MYLTVILVIVGFLLLIYGGDRVCCGASAIAMRLHISQFVIGMTIVAISTSAPELITSIVAALDNHQEIVLGNVIGSNLVNIGLAGGLVALIKPFDIPFRIEEVPFFCLISCIFGILILISELTAFEGILLCLLGFLYIIYVCRLDRRTLYPQKDRIVKKITKNIHLGRAFGTFFWGIGLLLVGAKIVIYYSIAIANKMEWSDSLVGFTIIAIGTSFPEIITSLIASFRGYGSICIGNIIGSNIFNILIVAGTSACICPLRIENRFRLFGIPFFVVLTSIMGFFLAVRRTIDRFNGLILFMLYLVSFYFIMN
ncbi:MAG: calcium/sodium antiporter [Puniceicoccales bacterium]|jgi:cation:H+ antiporter|nr:calcium/sodium antiporter [Puniceicoccales bacterium]